MAQPAERRLSRIISHIGGTRELTLIPNQTSTSDNQHSSDVFIVGATRTPMGSFGGALSGMTAVELGSHVIKHALDQSKVASQKVDEVYMGNVLSANLGQAPARQAALGAGLNDSVPCTTVNKVCSSGLKAVMLASQTIQLGQGEILVAGGMESMSNVPYYLPKARFGMKFGNGQVVDGLSWDGLTDAYAKTAMGNCAELCASEHKFSRQEQDAYAEGSYHSAIEATKSGVLKAEITPVTIKVRGKTKVVENDEELDKVNFSKLGKLKPVFKKNGSVTAGNASAISDGAAAVVLASKRAIDNNGLKPLARIIAYADAAQEPNKFTTAPALAIDKVLKKAGLSVKDVDYWEINEAFAVVALANQKLVGMDPKKVNIWGGGVSVGHPLGTSGCRILVTLLNVLQQKGGKIGVAAICNGGGGASAMVVERL